MSKFEKGHPGGPGRPRGSRNAVNLMLDQLAEAEAATVLRKILDAAAEGNQSAARLVMSRIWAAPKGRTMPVELPPIDTPDDLLAAHAVVTEAISDGRLTPQDAASLATVLETHRRAFELVAQERKIEELDGRVRQVKENIQCP